MLNLKKMAIPSRQIGWGTEDNLLWQISKQLERLTCVTAGGCGSITTTTTTTLPVYRVYTALLNQSGTSDNIGLYSGNTTIGVTYTIIEDGPLGTGYDFTVIGAPNNDIGTVFVATGTTPTWGIDSAVGLSYDAGAPVANVLENTIGNIWFIYSGEGLYYIKSSGLFSPSNKSCVAHSGVTSDDGGYSSFFVYSNIDSTADVKIFVTDLVGLTRDNVLNNYLIEIRVYN